MTAFKKGDRVKVTFEATVDRYNERARELCVDSPNGRWDWVPTNEPDSITIEKIEPPVEVFKPGDVVRNKHFGHIFALGSDGYFDVTCKRYRKLGSVFTSREWEKVDLSGPPF